MLAWFSLNEFIIELISNSDEFITGILLIFSVISHSLHFIWISVPKFFWINNDSSVIYLTKVGSILFNILIYASTW